MTRGRFDSTSQRVVHNFESRRTYPHFYNPPPRRVLLVQTPHMDAPESLRIARQKLLSTRDLLSRDNSRAAISRAVESGDLVRLRPGWFVDRTTWEGSFPETRAILAALAAQRAFETPRPSPTAPPLPCMGCRPGSTGSRLVLRATHGQKLEITTTIAPYISSHPAVRACPLAPHSSESTGTICRTLKS